MAADESTSTSNNKRQVDVALELVIPSTAINQNSKPVCKKLAKSPTSLRFIIQKLPPIMDADTAQSVTALILDELERLPVPGRFAKLVLNGVKFTKEGCSLWQDFLKTHVSSTLRHVALNQVLVNDNDQRPPSSSTRTMIHSLMQAVQSAPLTVLDLSKNVLHGPDVWNIWKTARHIQLKQFILDSVDLNDESWCALVAAMEWDKLDDLHVVAEQPPSSDEALQASQDILRMCSKLSSLRWIQKRGPDTPLPWLGLRDMARMAGKRGAMLKHLVLEGPGTPEFCQPHDIMDLASGLEHLPRLKTLKLRHLGLTDLASICVALRASRPPLEIIDFSYNEISSTGAHRLAELIKIPKMQQALQLIVMNDNRIETTVARELLETFRNLISLDNNPGVDFCRIVTEVLAEKKQLETERNDLRQQLEQRAYESGGGANVDILQKENRRLRDERDMLAKAFSIIGISHEVDEHKRLLDRVQRLEDMMVLGSAIKGSVSNGGDAGSKAASRRRINVNDLPNLDRLNAAAHAAASRNPSQRSLGGNRRDQMVRQHSSRSNVSRGAFSTAGNTTDDSDEGGGHILESPHPHRGDRSVVSTSANTQQQQQQQSSQRRSNYTRTPSQSQRSTVPRDSALPAAPNTPDSTTDRIVMPSSMSRPNQSGNSNGGLEPSLRRSSYDSKSPGLSSRR